MTDIATLGLVVDSSQVTSATKALDGLTAASTPAAAATANLGKAADASAKSHAGMSTQAMSAFHSVRSMAEGFALGMPPTQVLTQQLNHLSYAASGPQGLTGAFKEVAGVMLGFLSPTLLAVGAIAAIGVGAVTAATSWTGAQHTIELGLMGIGRASQATVGDINHIAESMTASSKLSTSEARDTATTLAATGKIGVDNIQLLTANTQNFAKVLGLDVPKAAETMAKIFANPTEGAKILAEQIGGIDAVTLKYIQTLEQQGNRQAAIKVLADAVIPAISSASDKTGNLAAGWTSVSNAASNAWGWIGKSLSGTLDQQAESDLEKRRQTLEKLIADTQKLANVDGPDKAFNVQALGQYTTQLFTVNDALMKVQATRKAALGVDAAQTSLQVSPIVNTLAPAPELIRNVTANLEFMTKAMNDPAQSAFVERMGTQLPQALARLQNQAAALNANPRLADPISSQIDSLRQQNRLLDDNSAAVRQSVAFQLAKNEAIKQGASAEEANTIATLRGKQAEGGDLKNIADQQKRIALLGETATVQERVRAVELQIRAARLNDVTISDTEEASLKRIAEERALGITQMRDSTRSLRAEADTAGMSVGEQQKYLAAQVAINGQRNANRPLDEENIARINREATALGQAAQHADNMKWAYNGLVQGPMQAFTSAISSGSNAMDALKKSGVSALNALSSKLMDMAAQNLWKSAFGGSSGGGIMSLLGLNPNAGGNVLPGSTGNIDIGGYSMPQFAAGTDSAPGGLARINEAGGEIVNLPGGAQVIPHDVSMAMASRVAAPATTAATLNTTVNVPINIDATGADPAALARVQQQLTQLKAELPARIVAAVTTAKQQRRL
jgi:hypothetical protein